MNDISTAPTAIDPSALFAGQHTLQQFENFFELQEALAQLEINGLMTLAPAERQLILIELQSFLQQNRRNPSSLNARKQYLRVKKLAEQFKL